MAKKSKEKKEKPLIEVRFRLNKKAIHELRTNAGDVLGGIKEKLGDAFEQVKEGKTLIQTEAGKALIKALGLVGIEEIKFKGETYRPADTETASTKDE